MLNIENLYAGYDGVDVLHDVSVSLSSGNHLAIIGPNGCGKTTLLRAIAGLLPIKGTIQADEINVSKAKRYQIAKKIALMSQMPFVTFGYTVRQAVEMGRYVHRRHAAFELDLTKDDDIVEQCLIATGLSDLQSKSITQLSGGQLQRVFLARTLCQQPDIILLDEPTNHMDVKHQAELFDYLKRWGSEDNHTIIAVIHDLTTALQLADKAVLLQHGKVFANGDIEKVLSKDNLNQVFQMDYKGYMINSLRRWENIK